MSEPPARGHLPRLPPEYYRGFAFVHWVMTVESRATGWLDARFHAGWREGMLHALVRYDLSCPMYCLMPDHVHFVWMGCSTAADQKPAVAFFRRLTNSLLAPNQWQQQAFDHVLDERERAHNAFQKVCEYIVENPVRKNLVRRGIDWAYTDALVPAYPDLSPSRADFWPVFWKIHNRKVDRSPAR